MIERGPGRTRIERLLRSFPVVGILGARQVGKTTLARQVAAARRGAVHWFDLEDPADRARLAEASLVLPPLRGLVVLDEIQRARSSSPCSASSPTDRGRRPASSSSAVPVPALLQQGSETLAGRVAFHRARGAVDRRGRRGSGLSTLAARRVPEGLPRKPSDGESFEWRRQFIAHVPRARSAATRGRHPGRRRCDASGRCSPTGTGRSGTPPSSPARSASPTRRCAAISTFSPPPLSCGSCAPWHENLAKRQVKLAEGLPPRHRAAARAARDPDAHASSSGHPKVGASWEGFALGGGRPPPRRRPARSASSGRPTPARSSTCSSSAAGSARLRVQAHRRARA